MSDDHGQDGGQKKVSPSDERELNDEALESVAGGCQHGCSNANSCLDVLSGVMPTVEPILKIDGMIG